MKPILVTGASGYIASRLIPRLLAGGYRVRCLDRQPQRLRRRTWYQHVETVAADVTRPETLPTAMDGVGAAYYLIHSMAAGHSYERIDLTSARNFAQAARDTGVEHIIYLGGLADKRDPQLALHMKSRMESGAALRATGPPVTEFRAGVIVGPGSVSFEMIRFIAEQFPLLVGPAWMRHKSQPIATQNVLDYLVAALDVPACRGKIVEIGGSDVMTYAENLTRFAALRGLKRSMLLLPFVPVWLIAFLIEKLTPVPGSYAFPLIEGLRNDSLVLDAAALQLFPAIKCLGYTESVRRALADLHPDHIERIWLDLVPDLTGLHTNPSGLSDSPGDLSGLQMKHEGMFIHYKRVTSAVPAAAVFAAVCRMGGPDGWPALNWTWQLRGWVDRLAGGRAMPVRDEPLRAGSRLDFYRVEVIQENLLRLRAELKTPGQGWMEWTVTPHANGCILEQTAFFAPKGLPGFLYWVLLNPFHRAVFERLAKALIHQAEKP